MPAFLQAFASSGSIGRDASLMSVSPLQNSANPSPVPGPSTLIATFGLVSLKSSATSDEIGSTVDEPEITIVPVRSADPPVAPVPPPSWSCCTPRLQAAATASARATGYAAVVLRILCIRNSSSVGCR